MKASQRLQKISTVISLVILALGFLLLGLVSLIPYSLGFSTMSCAIGGWASMATASIFLIAAFIYWRRCVHLALDAGVQARVLSPKYEVFRGQDTRDGLLPGVQPDCVPKSQEIIAQSSAWADIPNGF